MNNNRRVVAGRAAPCNQQSVLSIVTGARTQQWGWPDRPCRQRRFFRPVHNFILGTHGKQACSVTASCVLLKILDAIWLCGSKTSNLITHFISNFFFFLHTYIYVYIHTYIQSKLELFRFFIVIIYHKCYSTVVFFLCNRVYFVVRRYKTSRRRSSSATGVSCPLSLHFSRAVCYNW